MLFSPQLIRPNPNRIVAAAPATFDSATKFQITLSGGDLIATNSVGPGNFGDVRGTTSKSTGRFYIEFTMGGTSIFLGLCNSTQSFASGFFPGGDANSLVMNAGVSGGTAGDITFNGGAIRYTSSAFVAGDVDGLAIDVGAGLVWGRRNGGNWNDDILANQNPAVGSQVGGFNIAALGTPIYFMGYIEGGTSGTINTNPSSPPSGFGAWT